LNLKQKTATLADRRFRQHSTRLATQPRAPGHAPRCPGGIRISSGERDRLGCRFRRRAENQQQTILSNDGSGATPEPARGTRAFPIVQPKINSGKEFPFVVIVVSLRPAAARWFLWREF